jgi:gamma-D-glutamyl-L-lysine dipeptidyl-peptidase
MKTVLSIRYFFPALLIFLYTLGCRSSNEKTGRVQIVADSISDRFIPDKRMGICEIKVTSGDEGALILSGETTNYNLKETIIKTLSNHGNKLIDSILILPDTLKYKKYTGLATLSVINIRKHPEHSAEMVSQAILGTPVRILKNEEDWLLVETPDHYHGWAESSSFELITGTEMARWKQSDRVITLVNTGWIYSSPDESGITGDFVAGCIFVKEGDNHGYTKVQLPDGREGYISSKFLMDFNAWRTNVKCTEESIVRCASTFIGLPYLWGGTSSRAVDCSGFSKTVYFLNGLILLRDASQQALHGLNVSITPDCGQMKPGDLLFFGSRENSKLHVTHVAVYKGDSEYINSSGRVQVSSLDSKRRNYNDRAKSLLAVKRIIGATDDPGIIAVKLHPWY